MVQVAEIKKEIGELPEQEYINLRQWFAKKDWEIWDKQIKEDSNSGKLDFLAKEALQEKNNDNLKALLKGQGIDGYKHIKNRG